MKDKQNQFYTSISKYYSEIFPYKPMQLQYVKKRVGELTEKKILDIGCATGELAFNLVKEVNNLNVVVRNPLGQIVTRVINSESFAVGNYRLNVDEGRKLIPGIYFIEFNADDNVRVEKLIVQ